MKKGLLVINTMLCTLLLSGCQIRGLIPGGLTSNNPSTSSNTVTSNSTTNSGSKPSSNSSTSNPTTNTSDSGETPISVTINTHKKSEYTNLDEDNRSHTIMIYMCGSDLESEYELASSDIEEIISVSGQPNNVNVVIQTGGADINNTYFSKTQGQRWHVSNKKLVRDASFTKVNMGLSSTFADFIKWGVQTYPADKYGVVLWNHGGAMEGCCYDELYSSYFTGEYLTPAELNEGVESAFNTLGISQMEWIGYDCCLMQMQDIAELNSHHFKYMVGSEESENGYGWDYDTFLDDVYSYKHTETVLTEIVDGFIADNGGASASTYEGYTANQTMSWLDLSKMADYKTAWEDMAVALKGKITSSNAKNFRSLVNSSKHFAEDDYTYFGTFDALDFVSKLFKNSTFNPGYDICQNVADKAYELIRYSVAQKGAGNAYGLMYFFDYNGDAYHQEVYTNSSTNFTNWKYIVDTFAG